MALYDIEPLQRRIVEILKAVDETCRRHGLRYYITAGTMLGAVRHGGFIPWDDDLDICMPRPDYDRLRKHSNEWLPAPFEMKCAENDPLSPLPFAKIQDASTTLIERPHLPYLGGIYIDVFPIDGVPENPLRRRMHVAAHEFWKRTLYFIYRDPYKHGRGPSSWLPLLARRLFTRAKVQQKLRGLMTRYPYDDARLAADYDDGLRGVMEKGVWGEPTPVPFGKCTFMGYEHPHTYLSRKYGDYMIVPPGDHRRQHNFHYLDLDHPYRNFKGKVGIERD